MKEEAHPFKGGRRSLISSDVADISSVADAIWLTIVCNSSEFFTISFKIVPAVFAY